MNTESCTKAWPWLVLTNTPFEKPEFNVAVRDAAMEDRLALVIVVLVTPALDPARLDRARLGVKAVPVRAREIEVADGLAPASEREVTAFDAVPLGIEVLAADVRPAEVMSPRARGRDDSVLVVEEGEALMEDGERLDAMLEGREEVAVADGTADLEAGAVPDRMLLQGEAWEVPDTLAALPPALLEATLGLAAPVLCGIVPREDEPGVTARLEACSALAPEDERGA
jgi:hypothetical protein